MARSGFLIMVDPGPATSAGNKSCGRHSLSTQRCVLGSVVEAHTLSASSFCADTASAHRYAPSSLTPALFAVLLLGSSCHSLVVIMLVPFFIFIFRGAHDPVEQARQRARELEELRRREDEAVERLTSEALQVYIVEGFQRSLKA